jgi:hypothetical protein
MIHNPGCGLGMFMVVLRLLTTMLLTTVSLQVLPFWGFGLVGAIDANWNRVEI